MSTSVVSTSIQKLICVCRKHISIHNEPITDTMACILSALRSLKCHREIESIQEITQFIRKSDTVFDWRMAECYVCYREFEDTIPRAFPFECDHEICKECFVEYSKHLQSMGKVLPTCGMCKSSIRSDWNRASVVRSREIAPREWIWVPGRELTTGTVELQLDTLQYQLAHGTPPQRNRRRAYTV